MATPEPIDPRIVEIALDHTDTTDFERFIQAMFGAMRGAEFVPLGGMHDGGAEGYVDTGTFESSAPGHFMQASVTANTRAKIRHTMSRLRQVGRQPTLLTYFTSQTVQNIDLEEDTLSDECGCRIKIRDRKWLIANVNALPGTILAFQQYLSKHISFLTSIGSATLINPSHSVPSRSLCVFLGQEVERRRGNTELLESVTDSLILWAIEGTDPEKGLFMTKDDILRKVEETLPSSKQFFRGAINSRLQKLSDKGGVAGREVKFYRKDKKYCLPYETRKLVEAENIEDETLKFEVSEILRLRMCDFLEPEENPEIVDTAIALCHRALDLTFENQGVEISYFINDAEAEDFITPSIQDNIIRVVEDAGLTGAQSPRISEIIFRALRGTFYDSTAAERRYLGKLSRTYLLIFILKNDPKVVEYFRTMSSQFELYAGADILVRCLSEYYLAKKDQMTTNALEIIRAAGSNLILSEITLEEVWTHIAATDYEYRNNYSEIEPHLTLQMASQIDRILIRSYLYARLAPMDKIRRPAGWKTYIRNFCDYDALHYERGKEQLREYLVKRFGLQYQSRKEIGDLIDESEVDSLTKKIYKVRVSARSAEDKERLLARRR